MYKKILLAIFVISISINSEKINFTSSNPFTFRDVIIDLDKQEKQEVYGILKFPEENYFDKQYPLVIGVAGSIGWLDHHEEALQLYRDLGIATFELHSFDSRGVKSTVGEQTKVTTAMMILDSYKALDKLSEHPNIDSKRAALTGWSLGGGTALLSGWNPLINAINPNERFAAHLAYYPPCVVEPENLSFTDAPVHILIGEIDDWTPASACLSLVESAKKFKDNIEITIFEDAHHSFDSKIKLTKMDNGYSLTDCMFKLNDDGTLLLDFMNFPMTSPYLQKIALAFCAKRGTTVEGNKSAKQEAHKISVLFMKKHLLDIK